MKTKSQIILAALLMSAFTYSGCEQKTATENTGTTTTEDMVEGADGGLDSLNADADSTVSITADTLTFQ